MNGALGATPFTGCAPSERGDLIPAARFPGELPARPHPLRIHTVHREVKAGDRGRDLAEAQGEGAAGHGMI